MLRALLIVLLVSGCVKSASGLDPAEAPLELTLKRFPEQVAFSLASLRGQVVLVDVWATWCEPCRESLPRYEAMVEQRAAQGATMYALSVDAETAWQADVPRFISELKLRVPVLLDPDGAQVERVLKVKMMPTAVLLDRKGRVRHVIEGWDEAEVPAVAAKLEALLAE